MALITDDFIEVELKPRTYQEDGNDPFVLSIFELSESKKVIVRDFSAVLLKSEYEKLVSEIEDLMNNKLKNLYFETIEPLFILRMNKVIEKYVIEIEVFINDEIQSEQYEIKLDEEHVKCFLKDLKYDIENIKKPPKLP
ncbi:hypothetical protein [Bacillus sp. I-2]|uniref:WapI family immunity protein n=1 Tax=Bacillus sp. I-2 TaxID=1857572 RepID=UPI00097591D7|nr:hypothetical protein [Bacillus sp. I-2]OMP27929.1 hypothetical protein BAE31_07160 [Bacillus sp. I-2]